MSFEIHITPDVEALLAKAPRKIRAAVQRRLREIARIAALRSWEDADEERDRFCFDLASYQAWYSLDVPAKRLTLWSLHERPGLDRTG